MSLKSQNKNQKLELLQQQQDFLIGEYIDEVVDEYSSLIGRFLITFSCLEHELNLAIAEWFADDLHEIGYMIIEKLSFSEKIDLYYKLYNEEALLKNKKTKIFLDGIKKNLESINIFRNNIVHANWQSLSKDKFVRTKIVVDKQQGGVKFKKIKINQRMIRQKIKEIDDLVEKIGDYR